MISNKIILSIFLGLTIGCTTGTKKQVSNQENLHNKGVVEIASKKDSVTILETKQAVVVTKSCLPNFKEIVEFYTANDITSGRMNKPSFIYKSTDSSSTYYGYYSLIERDNAARPPLVGKVLVCFKNQKWEFANNDQKVIGVVVKANKLRIESLSGIVGNKFSDVWMGFTKSKNKDFWFLKKDDCRIVAKVDDKGIVERFFIWNSESKIITESEYEGFKGLLNSIVSF